MKMEERRRHAHIHFHLGAEQGYWKDISYEGSGVGNTFLNKMKKAERRRQAHIRLKNRMCDFHFGTEQRYWEDIGKRFLQPHQQLL